MLTTYVYLYCNRIGAFFLFTFIAVQKDIFILHIAYRVQKNSIVKKRHPMDVNGKLYINHFSANISRLYILELCLGPEV